MRGSEEKRVRGKGVVPCCVSLSHNNYNAASPPLSLLQNVHEVYWLLLISVCTHIFINISILLSSLIITYPMYY